MYTNKDILRTELNQIKKDGLYKSERKIDSDQQSVITVKNKKVLNLLSFK